MTNNNYDETSNERYWHELADLRGRKARKLKREAKELNNKLNSLIRELERTHVEKNQLNEHCKLYNERVGVWEDQGVLIYRLLGALGPCEQKQGLYANVAAALARAALGGKR